MLAEYVMRCPLSAFEEFFPRPGVPPGQCVHVVLHFEQRAARLAAVDDPVQRVCGFALRVDALEPGVVRHGIPPRKVAARVIPWG